MTSETAAASDTMSDPTDLTDTTESRADALASLFDRIAREWSDDSVFTEVYFKGFDTAEKISALLQNYGAMLGSVANLESSIGCDIGCWMGFSTAVQAALGSQLVYGIEVDPEFTRRSEAFRTQHELAVRYRTLRDGIIPLQTDSIDWVIINQVMCNAEIESFWQSLREAARILKPGGLLAFCDSNNPHCPDTLERLRSAYRRQEIGDGTLEAPNGPNHRQRRSVLRKAFPDMDAAQMEEVARRTCYMGETDVLAAARIARESGVLPDSPFVDGDLSRPTVSPVRGTRNGNITDPFAIARRMETLGFTPPEITVSPLRTTVDNETLWEQLRTSQGFYVFAEKRRA